MTDRIRAVLTAAISKPGSNLAEPGSRLPPFIRALLLSEAVASVRMDQTDDDGTHSVGDRIPTDPKEA